MLHYCLATILHGLCSHAHTCTTHGFGVYECYIGFPSADSIVVCVRMCVKAMLLKLCCVGIMCTCCGRFYFNHHYYQTAELCWCHCFGFGFLCCRAELSECEQYKLLRSSLISPPQGKCAVVYMHGRNETCLCFCGSMYYTYLHAYIYI